MVPEVNRRQAIWLVSGWVLNDGAQPPIPGDNSSIENFGILLFLMFSDLLQSVIKYLKLIESLI